MNTNNRPDQSAVVPIGHARRTWRRAAPRVNHQLVALAASISANSASTVPPVLAASSSTVNVVTPVEVKEEKESFASSASGSTPQLVRSTPEAERCAICYDPLGPRYEVFPCSHRLHVVCARQAISNDPRCPLCRAPVPSDVYIDINPPAVAAAVPPNVQDVSPPAVVVDIQPDAPVPRPISIVAGHARTRVEVQPVEQPAGIMPRTVYFGMLVSLSLATVMALRLGPFAGVSFAIFLFVYQMFMFRQVLRLWKTQIGARMVYSDLSYYDTLRNSTPEEIRQLIRASPSAPRQVWWYLSLSFVLDRFMQHCCVGAGIQNKIETGRVVSFRFFAEELTRDDVRPVTNRTVRRVEDPVMLELGVFESRTDMSSRFLIVSPEVRNSVVPQLSTVPNSDRYSLSATRCRAGIAPLGIDSAIADEVIESTALAAHVQANNNDVAREGLMVAMGLKAPARQDSCNMVTDIVCLTIFLCGLCLLAALGSISSLLSGWI